MEDEGKIPVKGLKHKSTVKTGMTGTDTDETLSVQEGQKNLVGRKFQGMFGVEKVFRKQS